MKKYDRYKSSGIEWVGEVPEHWEVKKLKYIAQIVLGKMLTPEAKEGYVLKPYLRAQNIHWFNVDVSETKEMWFSEVELKKLRVLKGDLLVSEGGEVGRTCIWNDELRESYIQNSVHKVTFFDHANSYFYLCLFFLYGSKGAFDSIVSRVSIAHLTGEKLKEITVINPPIKEQKAIAKFLESKTSQIDNLIQKKQQMIALLEEEKTAVINEAVTKGLNPDAPMKDSEIEWLGMIPEHWEVKKIKNICSVRQGLQIQIEKRFTVYFEGAYEYITIRSIHNPDSSKEYIKNPSERVVCTTDDILVARTGATGEIIKGVEGVFHNNFFLVDFERSQVEKDYLYFFLKNKPIKDYLLLVAGTTTIPDLNHGAFYSTPFFQPPMEEQREIINYILAETQQSHLIIKKVKKEISLLQEYRTALISEAVTGKIDVRDYQPEPTLAPVLTE